jgi:hypothetical protein
MNSPFSTTVNLGNEGSLFSACSNPTNVVLVTVFGLIIEQSDCYWECQRSLVRNH